ncbi:hypothetical protein MASR1M74_08560 [Lentimicrobium sp.]
MKSKYPNWSIIIFILLTILIGGCEKDDHTLPAKFTLNFTLNKTPVLDGAITIDEIRLGLNSISISGYREEGGDVFLTRHIDKGKIFVVKPSSNLTNETFDIPQGVYNPLTFSYIFQPDEKENELIDDLHDWLEDLEEGEDLEDLQNDLGDIIEDYLEDVNPCIMVKGRFTKSGKTRQLLIVINDQLTFKILGNNKNGGPEVVLDKENNNTGNMQLNPAYWFSVITPEMLNGAFVGVIDNEEYILLNKYVNTQMYTSIFNRIEQSTTLSINE